MLRLPLFLFSALCRGSSAVAVKETPCSKFCKTHDPTAACYKYCFEQQKKLTAAAQAPEAKCSLCKGPSECQDFCDSKGGFGNQMCDWYECCHWDPPSPSGTCKYDPDGACAEENLETTTTTTTTTTNFLEKPSCQNQCTKCPPSENSECDTKECLRWCYAKAEHTCPGIAFTIDDSDALRKAVAAYVTEGILAAITYGDIREWDTSKAVSVHRCLRRHLPRYEAT